jgi:hypothetical protein
VANPANNFQALTAIADDHDLVTCRNIFNGGFTASSPD